MSGDIKQEIKTFRAPSLPTPPPEPTAQAPAPEPAAAPAPPAQDPLAMMNAPSAPKAPPAPPPVPAAPAPPPAAAAPAPAPTGYATDGMLLQTKVNGKLVDVPISDVRKSVQMLSAAEQKFAEAGRIRAELQREADLGRAVLANQNNPQMMLQRLAELTGRPLAVPQTEAEDDGLDPHTRELKAELSEVKRVLSSFQQERAQQHTNATLSAIREELGRFPLYQQDPGELEHAELVVAAFVSKDPSMSRSQIAEIAGELHAKRFETIARHTTNERDLRAATAATLATVPPSAGTPGLTDNSPPKIAASEWQKGPGAFRAGLDNLLSKLTQP